MEWDARETMRITDKMTLHFQNVQTFLVGQMAIFICKLKECNSSKTMFTVYTKPLMG